MGHKWINRNDDNLIFAHPDKGCEFAESCLNCPFKTCYWDLSEKERRGFANWNKERIKEFLLNKTS